MTSGTSGTRRTFLASTLACAVSASVADMALRGSALAAEDADDIKSWLDMIEDAAQRLRDGALSEAEWQDAMAVLTQQLPLQQIAGAIDFEAVASTMEFAEKGVTARPVRFLDGAGQRMTVYPKVFAVGKDRAVIPHGHKGMVSGHLVLRGAFHLRQYNVHDTNNAHWDITPTIDRVEGVGGFSTISDTRDNVHWLIAREDSYTLDFIIAPTYPDTSWTVQNLDMDAAEQLGDGKLRVPTLPVNEALQKYG